MKTIYNPHSITMRIRILHQKGLTVSEIAEELKSTNEIVLAFLMNLGLKPNKSIPRPKDFDFPKNIGKRVVI